MTQFIAHERIDKCDMLIVKLSKSAALGLIILLLVGPACAADSKQDLVLQVGHTAGVQSARFSHNSKFVVTGSRDNKAILWNVETGEILHTFTGHKGGIRCVRFSRDDLLLATSSSDMTAKLWDIKTGKLLQTFTGEHSREVNCADFVSDRKHLVTGSVDGTAVLWDITTGQKVRAFAGVHSTGVNSVHTSEDGKWLVTGSMDTTAAIWDLNSAHKLIRKLTGHTNGISGVEFSRDGTRIATCSYDSTAKIWNVADGALIKSFSGSKLVLNGLSLSADGRQIAVAGYDGENLKTSQINKAVVWDLTTGAETRIFDSHTDGVNTVQFSADGRNILTGSSDCTAVIWEVQTGKVTRRFACPLFAVNCLRLSKNGTVLVAGCGKTAMAWDLRSGKPIGNYTDHKDEILAASVNRDGSRAFTGSRDGVVAQWNTTTGAKINEFVKDRKDGVDFVKDRKDGVNDIDLSSDGRLLTSYFGADVFLWDVGTGKKIAEYSKGSSAMGTRFTSDGDYVLIGESSRKALFRKTNNGQPHRWLELHKSFITCADAATEKGIAVTGSYDGTVIVWRVSTGQAVESYSTGGHPVSCLHLSGDGRTLVIGTNAGIVTVQATVYRDKGDEAVQYRGHTGEITGAQLTSDGSRLFTSSKDGSIIVWNTKSATQLCTLYSFNDCKEWLVVDPDGIYDASKGGFTRLRFRQANNDRVTPASQEVGSPQPGLLARTLKHEK